jgi:hypothetical protein
MTREQFQKLTGEDPADVLGEDWEEQIDDYLEDSEHFHEGHTIGSCFDCKMD